MYYNGTMHSNGASNAPLRDRCKQWQCTHPIGEIKWMDEIAFWLSQIGYCSHPGNLKIWSVTMGVTHRWYTIPFQGINTNNWFLHSTAFGVVLYFACIRDVLQGYNAFQWRKQCAPTGSV
jgi:hypothetical protein